MDQQRYWRNLIADEIKAEHDRVKKYYMKKGMNSGGISTEEQTRLNIFMLCDSIIRTMKDIPDAPSKKPTVELPKPTVEPTPTAIEPIVEVMPDKAEEGEEDINNFLEEQTSQVWNDISQEEVSHNEQSQNQFGEFI